tara:strand:+ start:86 stop:760 length:675 start_codon:yes stop_codon:yes gene_type:complete
MHLSISKKIIIYLFLFFLLGTVNNNSIKYINFSKIENIEISGLDQVESKKIRTFFNDSNYKNIFFADKLNIIKKIYSLKTVEELNIFKNYPSTLKIDVKRAEYLAITNKNGLNYYIGSNGELIEDKTFSSKLPYVFGDLNIQKFFELKNEIEKSEFKFNKILNLYFFKSNRWDIETTDGYLVKLPINDIKGSLNLFILLVKENDFKDKLVIDLRQKNQVVLNEQ